MTPRGMVSSSRMTSTSRSRLSACLGFTAASRDASLEPESDGARVRVERFGLAQRDGGRTQNGERASVALDEGGPLHEIEDAEARREPRRARGRQDVVRAADIVADRLRRVRPDEDRAGVVDSV